MDSICVCMLWTLTSCHNHDHTYPYSPYPDLSMPILSHQNHSQAPNAKSEPSGSILSQLASNASLNPQTPLHLSNALLNTLTPLCLANAFPTRRSFDLSSSSRQVDSQHPHPFLTRHHSTFSVLASSPFLTFHQSRDCGWVKPDRISLTQCILVCPFLALYISVHSLCLITHYSSSVSSIPPSVPRLH